jgi:hypothetical protein
MLSHSLIGVSGCQVFRGELINANFHFMRDEHLSFNRVVASEHPNALNSLQPGSQIPNRCGVGVSIGAKLLQRAANVA